MPLEILLIEDNVGDVMLVREALEAHGINARLNVIGDCQNALLFISTLGRTGGPPCPDVILLDLNLPKGDGTTVLSAFRANRESADIPVIIVSSSDSFTDRGRAAALGVSHYFRKPSDFDEFTKLGEVVRWALGEAESRPPRINPDL